MTAEDAIDELWLLVIKDERPELTTAAPATAAAAASRAKDGRLRRRPFQRQESEGNRSPKLVAMDVRGE
jgi:hypothetical protein